MWEGRCLGICHGGVSNSRFRDVGCAAAAAVVVVVFLGVAYVDAVVVIAIVVRLRLWLRFLLS